MLVSGRKGRDTVHERQSPWQAEPAPCGTVPLAEFVRMKSQLQECIEMLRTENSSISDRLLNMEKLRLKVHGVNALRPTSVYVNISTASAKYTCIHATLCTAHFIDHMWHCV